MEPGFYLFLPPSLLSLDHSSSGSPTPHSPNLHLALYCLPSHSLSSLQPILYPPPSPRCLPHPNSSVWVSAAVRPTHHGTWQVGRLTLSCTSWDPRCSPANPASVPGQGNICYFNYQMMYFNPTNSIRLRLFQCERLQLMWAFCFQQLLRNSYFWTVMFTKGKRTYKDKCAWSVWWSWLKFILTDDFIYNHTSIRFRRKDASRLVLVRSSQAESR